MTNQNYLIVEANIVTNNVVWDGNTQTWTPPTDSIQLIQNDIPTITWQWNEVTKDFELSEKIGVGQIGFTWDGSVLTTNQPKPIYVSPTA